MYKILLLDYCNGIPFWYRNWTVKFNSIDVYIMEKSYNQLILQSSQLNTRCPQYQNFIDSQGLGPFHFLCVHSTKQWVQQQ